MLIIEMFMMIEVSYTCLLFFEIKVSKTIIVSNLSAICCCYLSVLARSFDPLIRGRFVW